MQITYEQFVWAIARMKAENLVHPSFAISLQKPGWIEPHRRSVHWLEWPAPIYHNDNAN